VNPPAPVTELQLAALMAAGTLIALQLAGRLEFVRREMAEGARRGLALALLFAILALAVFLPVATFGRAQELDLDEIGFLRLFAGHAVLLIFLAAWWWLAGRPGGRVYLALPRRPLAPEIRAGLLAGAVGWAATLTLTAIVAATASSLAGADLGPSAPPPLMLWLADLPAWRKLLIVGVAMTVEEAFFRAFLQQRLGLGLSTALFALAHFNYGLPFLVVAVFSISLIFGALFEVRRHLLACVVAHGVFDAIQIFLIIPMALRGM